MPMSRPRKNQARKAIKPVAGTPTPSGVGDGMAVKQYKQSAKKYSGPNYPQKDKGVKPFGGK